LTDNVLTRDTGTLFEGSETVACNLLLVEDDALSRRNLAIFFQQSEQNVYEADTGEIAVELIDRITFDVVVSDFRLPGRLSGVDVLRHHFRLFL
jgi:DNA-binding response OmpR family regulator